MILAIFSRFPAFSSIRFILKDNKYLVPEPPKRPFHSYNIFYTQLLAKKKSESGTPISIGEISRSISESWKQLPAQEKKKYEDKAVELRVKYKLQKAQYDAKFVKPFEKMSLYTYLMKEFFKNNKLSLQDGSKAFRIYFENLKIGEKQKAQKLLDQQKKKNEELLKHFQIPQFPYANFTAYYRSLRKENPNLPKLRQVQQKVLEKHKKKYEDLKEKHSIKFNSFAGDFQLKPAELVRIVNKQKPEAEKLNEEGRSLKQTAQKILHQKAQEIKKEKLEASKELAKLKVKHKKEQKNIIKKMERQLEKKKLGVRRVKVKLQSKIEKIERAAALEKVNLQTQKELKKETKTRGQKKSKQAIPTPTVTETPKEVNNTEASLQSTSEVKA